LILPQCILELGSDLVGKYLRLVLMGMPLPARAVVPYATSASRGRRSAIEQPPGTVRIEVPVVQPGLRIGETRDKFQLRIEVVGIVEPRLALVGDDYSHAHRSSS
jgi:hypothetical protein